MHGCLPGKQRHVLCCREWAAQKEREALQAAARAGQADQVERHLQHLQQQLAEAVSKLSHSRQLQLDLAGKRRRLRLSKAAAATWRAVHTHIGSIVSVAIYTSAAQVVVSGRPLQVTWGRAKTS